MGIFYDKQKKYGIDQQGNQVLTDETIIRKDANIRIFIGIGFTLVSVALIVGLFWGFPKYKVWQKELAGKAQLAEAEWNRQIQIREAEANLQSEKLNAQSEVERAKGAAEAIQIEGGSLTDNYIKYLWVRQLNTGEKQLIYVPTEAGLPILEAGRK